jgi:hypothetical protein
MTGVIRLLPSVAAVSCRRPSSTVVPAGPQAVPGTGRRAGMQTLTLDPHVRVKPDREPSCGPCRAPDRAQAGSEAASHGGS